MAPGDGAAGAARPRCRPPADCPPHPPQVRRPPPAEDPGPARRLLLLLLAVVFCQILAAEDGVPAPQAAEDAPGAAPPAPAALEPRNRTAESPDYALDLSAWLQRPPASL